MKQTWDDYNDISMLLAKAHPEIDFPGDVDGDLVIQGTRELDDFVDEREPTGHHLERVVAAWAKELT